MRVTAICVLGAALAACAGPAADARGSAGPSTGPSGTAPATARVSLDATGSHDGSLPAAPPLPAGFPIHPSMAEAATPAGATAAWTSDAPPPDVYDYYRAALPEAGFTLDLEAPGGAAAILRFRATDGTRYQLEMTGVGPLTLTLGAPHP